MVPSSGIPIGSDGSRLVGACLRRLGGIDHRPSGDVGQWRPRKRDNQSRADQKSLSGKGEASAARGHAVAALQT